MYRRPFKRFAAPRGRLFSRRRFGPRLRTPKEPQRWEVGHFFFGNIINITDNATNPATIVTSFAQIADHFGVAATAQGISLDNAVRFLEIGGIVFRYEIISSFSGSTIPSGTSELANGVNWRVLLVTDRLTESDSPVSIPNWFNVTQPVVAAASLDGNDQENVYPTRIHWQNFHRESWSNREGNGTGAVGPQTFHTANTRGGANLRLRLRLDDQHGLFWHFAQSHSNSSSSENQFVGQLVLTGTIYYRFRF